MSEVPDRLSVEEGSPFYDMDTARRIEVYFKGARQMHVMEYCISEGWIRRRLATALGVVKLERGKPIVNRFEGEVVVTWKA